MKKLIFLICLLIPVISFGQNDTSPAPEKKPHIYRIVEKFPEFPGGIDSLFAFINANMIYPQDAAEASQEGTVFVEFVVRKNGKITDPKVLRGVSKSIDKEALRIISILPNFKPALHRGQPADVYYNIPIRFILP